MMRNLLVLFLVMSSNAFAGYDEVLPTSRGGTGNTTGNATTATALQTARTINGTSFNGTANVTVTAAAGTLTGSTLNSTVTASSLTSVGTLANLTVTNPIVGSVTGASGSTTGNAATATALQTARTINGTPFDGTTNITIMADAPNPAIVNGGNTAYTILTTDKYVRSSTTMTVDRAYTLPACTGGNLGEQHTIKNLASQTKNITLTPNGADTIDGAASVTLLPGDSASVTCAVSTAWDLN